MKTTSQRPTSLGLSSSNLPTPQNATEKAEGKEADFGHSAEAWKLGLQEFDFYQALIQAYDTELISLRIPETLLVGSDPRESVLLFTDKSGSLHCIRGEQEARNLNPLGLRTPKFTAQASGEAAVTFPRTSDLRLALHVPHTRFQRYLPSPKTLVRWRRTKPSKAYLLGAGTDLHFENCEQSRDRGLWEEEWVETVRRVVMRGIVEGERLEELMVVVCREADGKIYVVDAPKVKVGRKHKISVPGCPASSLVAAFQHYEFPSKLKVASLSASSKASARPSKPKPTKHPDVSTTPDLLISQCLSRVSAHLDSVLTESRELKKEFGIVMKVQLATYPKDLLDRVIHKVYERIVADPRLSRFYSDKKKIREKLENSVKSVFQNGLSRNMKARMREVHFGMGISERDFSLYVRYFAEAMREMDVAEDDVQQIIDFLEGFRDEVVQARLEHSS